MTDEERLKLLREVFDVVFAATESFELGTIGSDLSYLMGAILQGGTRTADGSYTSVDWTSEAPELLDILTQRLPTGHPVWQFIQK